MQKERPVAGFRGQEAARLAFPILKFYAECTVSPSFPKPSPVLLEMLNLNDALYFTTYTN